MNPVKVRGPTGLYAREAELSAPSRVACSDLLADSVIFYGIFEKSTPPSASTLKKLFVGTTNVPFRITVYCW